MSKDARIDAYIVKSADFAKPILEHIRRVVHQACPDVEETMKWSFPHFDYKGEMMCAMAAFKQHAVLGFWKWSLMNDPKKVLKPIGKSEGMGNFGRISSLKELPSVSVLKGLIKEAMRLNDEGISVKKTVKPPKKMPKTPPAFQAALKKNARALKNFENFPPSHKREYIEWIVDARQVVTRDRRITQAVEWITKGKQRNWKYQ